MNDAFEKELETLINRHCKENESNTPDFILAQYVAGCLAAFNTAVQQRETWYGRDPRPTSPFISGERPADVPAELNRPRPTIAELERILASNVPLDIEIQPDGSIRSVP